MAIVKTYYGTGITVHIDNDCYCGVSPDEMKERIERAQKIAWDILAKSEGVKHETAV